MDRFEIRAYPFHGLAGIELRIDSYRESILVGQRAIANFGYKPSKASIPADKCAQVQRTTPTSSLNNF